MRPSAAPFAKYNADGTGRDTYIRRDPVECFGKSMYKTEPRLVTRFGASGSAMPRHRGFGYAGFAPNSVGGENGQGYAFSRPDRFLRKPSESYPVEITQYSTMKEVVQDAYTSSQQRPGYLNHISGYQGFQPRCPPANVGTADWTDVRHCCHRFLRNDARPLFTRPTCCTLRSM